MHGWMALVTERQIVELQLRARHHQPIAQ
jgi:hypothetical protein